MVLLLPGACSLIFGYVAIRQSGNLLLFLSGSLAGLIGFFLIKAAIRRLRS